MMMMIAPNFRARKEEMELKGEKLKREYGRIWEDEEGNVDYGGREVVYIFSGGSSWEGGKLFNFHLTKDGESHKPIDK